MTHRKSGERRVFRTFGDGSFYLMGVRPGEWELTVDPKCLELIQATAQPLRLTMEPSAEGTTMSGLEVVLK